jgi:hypothetical protein
MPIFSTEALQKQVDAAVATVPPDHKGAVIGVVDSKGKVQLVFAGKVGEQWEVFGKLQKAPGQKLEGEGGIRYSW